MKTSDQSTVQLLVVAEPRNSNVEARLNDIILDPLTSNRIVSGLYSGFSTARTP